MSLKNAVTEIADNLEKVSDAVSDTMINALLKSYVQQLRIAVKASSDAVNSVMMPSAVQHAVMIEKHREEFRQLKKSTEAGQKITSAQVGGDRMLELVGGDNDGVMWPAPEELVEGKSRTRVGDDIYLFQAGRLVFDRKLGKGEL